MEGELLPEENTVPKKLKKKKVKEERTTSCHF